MLELSSKEELKIILWMEVTSSELAFVCLRNHNLIQLNLLKMEPISQINLFGARIIKQMPAESKQEVKEDYAYCTKSEMGFFSSGKSRGREKLDKSFILDMDVMALGLVVVTEEGKIAFLQRA